MASDVINGVLHATSAEWILILSLVFGGCCSNVWALEAVLRSFPASGAFLTFAQFAYVAALNLSSQVVFTLSPFRISFKPRIVPLRRWMVQVVLFLAVSLINNYVFALNIPLTLHIIFRSGGLCVSMLTGYMLGKRRFSFMQAIAAVIVTIGIMTATLSTPRRTAHAVTSGWHFFAGISLLTLALFLSAWLGLYQDETYKRYGKQWKEALFYIHFLSLPFFAPLYPSLSSTFRKFASSPPIKLYNVALPSALLALAVNVFTQGMCIRGVNKLTSRVNSTTVNLVLTVRKAVSLAISVWYNGTGASTGLVLGGAMVLVGTLLYTLSSGPVPIESQPKLKRKTQ